LISVLVFAVIENTSQKYSLSKPLIAYENPNLDLAFS